MPARVLVLSLAVLSLAIPATAAGATTFEGSCSELRGTLDLGEDTYSIVDEGISGGCGGVLNGTDSRGWLVSYRSSGAISGGCGAAGLGEATGSIDFYSVDIFAFPQVPRYVDTLEVVYGGGVIGPRGTSVRLLRGAAAGRGVEVGHFIDCERDDARYLGSFREAELSD